MSERRGPFWDVLEGRLPPPSAAVTLGWELVAVDPEARTIEVAFDASERFTNPIGNVQGGFLAAMLDDTLGPALVATLEPGQFAPTLELKVNFLRPAKPGRLIGHGPGRRPRRHDRLPRRLTERCGGRHCGDCDGHSANRDGRRVESAMSFGSTRRLH